MANMFKKPKPDKDQKALIEEQRQKIKDQRAEIEQRKHAKRRGQMGRQSLISGAETGVKSGTPDRTSLG